MRLVHRGLRLVVLMGVIGSVAILAPSTPQTSVAATSVQPCRAGDLEVALGSTGYGLGNWGASLLVVDPRGRTCTIEGYPTVLAYENTTKRWVIPLRSLSGYIGGLGEGQKIRRVVLSPYRVASFMLGGTDNPVNGATSCSTYVRVTVAFNGGPPSANIKFGLPACSRLEVHPIVYGPTGDQPLID